MSTTTAAETRRQADESRVAWIQRRLARHVPELVRLAIPAMGSRLGILMMAFADTVIVGRYSTDDLAYLTIANNALVTPLLVIGIGLFIGVIIFAANAFGRGDEAEVGRIFRRNLPFAVAIGLIMLALCFAGEPLLRLLGQTPVMAAESAPLIAVLGLGLPAHLLFFVSAGVLEGVKKPAVAAIAIVAANVLNALMDYALVWGAWGFPEMGAMGSAWTTTIIRWLMAGVLVAYVLYAPAMKRFGARGAARQRFDEWTAQRRMGYASAISLGAEVFAFGMLSIVAGWISTVAVAAMGITFNLMSIPFMLATGIGSATSVRVGIAHGRGVRPDMALAGWTGLGLCWVVTLPLGVFIATHPELFFALYSNDAALLPIAVSLIVYIWIVLPFDGGQNVVAMALRGVGDTWVPTLIQSIAYLGLMIPLSYALSIPFGHGPVGLMQATLIASVFSIAAQGGRFWWLTRTPASAGSRAGAL
ncbi:MATE family multidrug resistance protein [Rhodothalassium salexigens DSM 2132]|uniref:MATE family multidrug resistance protein n=1 Tax=Rhodothalassium salexigens DSM 2132 TaxID=1188247 RepID=A0A4R2PQL6_RHOSA|nr:MATE family efflux transporter [Rhodothalassium salexigens]MBB4210947.1 MATE family multidrug resistance protein [Rhodothalassium salexigens DSM 2132]MBK1639803.1 hypothetical protein [Rhodothalassium salexigens DSM 2132]TCP36395.1 MATE family multidrug resistance protein [Rhodothalassium salexigens DSM 2132]